MFWEKIKTLKLYIERAQCLPCPWEVCFSGRFLSSQSNIRAQSCSCDFNFLGNRVRNVSVLKGSPFFAPQMKDCLYHPPYDFISCSFICLRPQMSRTLELCNLIFQKTVFIWSQGLLLPYLMKLHWDVLFETSQERKLVITFLTG